MSLTKIPITKTTRNKLRDFATKSESYATNILFSKDSLTAEEAIKEITKWK